MQNNAVDLINYFELVPHPEGGYYRQTYLSEEMIDEGCLPPHFQGKRRYSTAIYYLLSGDDFSAFHRIKSDELWHFYAGDALNIYVINYLGELELIKLGSSIANGEVFQCVVKAGDWFAARTVQSGTFVLVGCTVSPGFDFADFELAEEKKLACEFPRYAGLIKSLCR